MSTFHLNFVQEAYIIKKVGYFDAEEVSINKNAYDFSVNYNDIDKSDILNIQKKFNG